MKMETAEGTNGIVSVKLIGRLDTPGVGNIETRLTASVVPRGARAIIDLSEVEFVGSLAIRMFITIAKALGRRNGKLVLYAPQPLVGQVLETASLNDIVPIRADADSAVAVASA
jgi:anti-sigma B factor antagonist